MTLKELREGRAYTQAEVAAYCGVTAAAVSMWESGKYTPGLTQLRKLAEFFKMTIPDMREVIKNSGGIPD
ncbi:MAG: helix-turn-helix transcriptional regulator [Ktedonobacterales bacterium]|nr:helix-turn-helix transcriptional regulator [Ktedonobacterales bacterium]